MATVLSPKRYRWIALCLSALVSTGTLADVDDRVDARPAASNFNDAREDHWLWRTLGDFVARRQYTLPEAQSVYSARQEYETGRLTQQPRLNLEVDMNIEDDDRDVPFQDGPFHNGQVALGLSIPILDPPTHYGVEANASRIELASRQLDSVLQSEAMDQLRKLTELAAINEQRRIRHRYIDNLEASVELAAASVEAGFGTEMSLTDLRLALSRAIRRLEETRMNQALLIEELRTKLGAESGIDERLGLDDLRNSLRIDPNFDFCDGVSSAVTLAKRQLDVAQRNLTRIQSEEQPSMELFSRVSRRYSDADPTNKYVNSVSAGVRFTWNLGMGLQNRDLELNARQRIYHAEEAVSQYRRLASNQCRSARRRYVDLQAAQRVFSDEVQASLRFVDYNHKRFRLAGLQTVPVEQLVHAESSLYEALENSLASRKQLVMAQWQLGSALGLIGVTHARLFIMD